MYITNRAHAKCIKQFRINSISCSPYPVCLLRATLCPILNIYGFAAYLLRSLWKHLFRKFNGWTVGWSYRALLAAFEKRDTMTGRFKKDLYPFISCKHITRWYCKSSIKIIGSFQLQDSATANTKFHMKFSPRFDLWKLSSVRKVIDFFNPNDVLLVLHSCSTWSTLRRRDCEVNFSHLSFSVFATGMELASRRHKSSPSGQWLGFPGAQRQDHW